MRLKPNLMQDQYGNIFYRKTIAGNRVIINAYTKNKTTANRLHTALEYQALMEHYAPQDKLIFRSFKELVKTYLKAEHNWSKASEEQSRVVLNHYLKTGKLPHNKETARGYQTRINACINWGLKQGYKTDHELMPVNKKKARFRVFDKRELSLLMNEVQDDDFQEFIKFAYFTGARRGEINKLKPYQCQPTRLQVTGKSGTRFIKLNAQARNILSCSKLWSYELDFVTKKFKWNARRLDIKDARFHDLRRTFGLNLIKGGMPIFQVSKLLGHSSVKVTEEHYAPLLIDDIEDFDLPT